LSRQGLQEFATLVSPRSLLGWHQRLIARKYDGSRRRAAGRPATAAEVRELVLKRARENQSWGYTWLQAALRNLEYEIGWGTVTKLIQEAGIEPAPDRERGTTWKELLRAPLEVLAAAGVESVRLPARSLNLNAFAERLLRTIKESCLNRLILVGAGSLRRAASAFLLHYHQERNHQGLENKIIQREFNPLPSQGVIRCRNRLGRLLHCYYHEAA
jgi:hypothetical protein